MNIVAGIDVSKATLDVYAQGKWKQVKNESSGFSSLRSFLKSQKVRLVVMEATGRYHEEVAFELHEAGFEVIVANPARSHYYAKSLGKRVKTDKVDAQVLARFAEAQSEQLERFVPPTAQMRKFKALVRLRHDLVRDCAGAKGRLKETRLDPIEKKLLAQRVEFFKTQIKELDQELRVLINQDEALRQSEKLLLTIPGVGPITAWTLIAEVGDFNRFDSAKKLAAFAGVCPSFQHSGTSLTGTGHMSKAGNRTLRKLLYLAAIAALRTNGVFKDQYCRMVEKGKAKMTAIVAVMHKILRVAYGVLKSGSPFIQERALTAEQ